MVETFNPQSILGGQGQVNPIEQFGRMAAIGNMLTQGQLLQQQQQARQTIGQIMQSTAKPDGTPDYAKAGAQIATHPATAWMAPDVLNTWARTRLIDADTFNTVLQGKRIQAEGLGGILAAVSKDPGVNNVGDFVAKGYASQMSELGIPNSDLINFISDPQKGLGAWGENQAFRDNALRHSMAYQHGAASMEAVTSNWTPQLSQNADGSWNSGWVNPHFGTAQNVQQPGGGTLGGALSSGPTAGAAALNAQQPTGPTNTGQGGDEVPAPPQAPTAVNTEPPTRFGTQSPVRLQRLTEIAPYEKDVNDRTSQANALLLQMNQAQDLLKNFTPNRAANIRIELGAIANAIGAPKELQDELANGSLADSQAARKLLFGVGSQLIGQLAHAGGGRLGQTMWIHGLNEGSANVEMTDASISKIMTAMREVAHVTNMERENFYGRQRQSDLGHKGIGPGFDMTNIRNDWANTLNAYLGSRGALPAEPINE